MKSLEVRLFFVCFSCECDRQAFLLPSVFSFRVCFFISDLILFLKYVNMYMVQKSKPSGKMPSESPTSVHLQAAPRAQRQSFLWLLVFPCTVSLHFSVKLSKYMYFSPFLVPYIKGRGAMVGRVRRAHSPGPPEGRSCAHRSLRRIVPVHVLARGAVSSGGTPG